MSVTKLREDVDKAIDDFVARNTKLAKGLAIQASETAFALALGGRRGRRPGRGTRKRSPDQLNALGDKFASFVEANPGLRIEQINRKIQTTTKELALPILKLVAEGRISTKGRKRATTYYPGKGTKR